MPSQLPTTEPRASAHQAPPSGATLSAVLDERARIARELHDSVSQTLYAIMLGASRARSLLEHGQHTDVDGLIEHVLELASAGQSELRALISDIRSDQPACGGLADELEKIATHVRTSSAASAPDIRLAVSDNADLPGHVRHALLMIVREALHNTARHSGARRVDVVLVRRNEQLELVITDDGRGFDPATPRPAHFGLQSMRERANAVGGSFALVSAVGEGTQLRVCVPCARG